MAFRFSDGPGAIEQIGELAAGYAIGGTVSTALEPLLQTLRNKLWDANPSLPVDPGTMALLARLGRVSAGDAAAEAAHSGLSGQNFGRYLAAQQAPPGTAELLELARRGDLSPDELVTWLGRAGLDERIVNEYMALQRNLLSVADLAMARQQEFIDDGELHARAALVGYEPADADLYFAMAGLPPGLGEGLELLRRGEIDEARFEQYVAEGHIKTKYTGDVLKLRYQPLSAAVAAEALIRERITEAEAIAIAEKNGLRADDFLTWSHMLGRPPGIVEALTLINRRVYGDPEGAEAQAAFREVVARSDVRTEYADALFNLRTHYPPLFQVERALTAGTITPELAADTLTKEGYPKAWVDAIVNANANGATAKAKELAASTVEALYEAGLDTHAEAAKALEALHYTPEQADQLLGLWLARRIVGELIRAVSIIRGRYVGWKIDRPTAVADLDQVLNDAATRDRLLTLWDLEHEANAPVLTPSQIGQAFKVGRFTLDQALQAWQGRGYTLDEATTLAWIEAKGNPFPAPPPPAPAG